MTPHLKGHVRAYVDRALPPAMLHLYDKHLVCCTMCRAAADQERRIVTSLRSDTGVPMSLRSSLMGLATAGPADAGAAAHSSNASTVPMPPPGWRMPSAPSHDPVPTVAPTAPALHRSPMRAAVVASIAAGASVAAAWGLAISPVPGSREPVLPGPVASFGAGPAGPVDLGGSVLPGSRVPTGARETQVAQHVVAGNVPDWMVTRRSSAVVLGTGSGSVPPLLTIDVRSAQSGP